MNIIVKATGERKIAIYATTPKGHKRMNVDGKFYTDKRFDELFEAEPSENVMQWRCHVKSLFEEIIENGGPSIKIADKPLRILYNILGEAANRALEINDKKLISIFSRLAMYNQTDNFHPDYDKDATEKAIKMI